MTEPDSIVFFVCRFVCITESVDSAVESAVSINVSGVVTANSLSAYSYMVSCVRKYVACCLSCSAVDFVEVDRSLWQVINVFNAFRSSVRLKHA
jgi:hypothetical protein